MGIYFAPRIKDVGSLLLYGFKSRKECEALDYEIIPDHYINKKLMEDHWDDILRVIISLKLGRTSAFTKLLENNQLRFDLQKLKEWKYKKAA